MLLYAYIVAEVYDVTPFIEYHPGGSQILTEHGGTDATEPFRCVFSFTFLFLGDLFLQFILGPCLH